MSVCHTCKEPVSHWRRAKRFDNYGGKVFMNYGYGDAEYHVYCKDCLPTAIREFIAWNESAKKSPHNDDHRLIRKFQKMEDRYREQLKQLEGD